MIKVTSVYMTHIISRKPYTFSTCIVKELWTHSIKYKIRTGRQGAGGHFSKKGTRVSQGALPKHMKGHFRECDKLHFTLI